MRVTFRTFFLSGVAVVATACVPAVSIDTRYANTGSGLVNTGLNQIGTLYYVNFASNQIQKLEEIDTTGMPTAGGKKGSTVSYGNLSAFGLDVESGKFNIAELKGQISRELSFKLEDFQKVSIRKPWDALLTAFQEAYSSDSDPWRMSESTENPRAFYLFVQGEVQAKKADIYFGSKKGKENGLSLNVTGIGSVKVNYEHSSELTWNGEGTAALIEVYWFQVYKDASGRLRYRTAQPTPDDQSRLSEILRKAAS